eukprot:CAMPEP_0197466606 /NCGR_PEP_ID=MMETSP1175-20131217/65142_1 /TAXON_ID=1003142 /ORGANISM="Triceratium dubium, Strain CCMP147" /LENGTH=98 /DNA_ID=CAMNT_0043002655 /DNA_START=166 /DNA_END=462 /DNA_ORIENTATION=+
MDAAHGIPRLRIAAITFRVMVAVIMRPSALVDVARCGLVPKDYITGPLKPWHIMAMAAVCFYIKVLCLPFFLLVYFTGMVFGSTKPHPCFQAVQEGGG